VLAVAFGKKLCWLESHYRHISLCTKGKQHQGKKVLYIVSSIFSYTYCTHNVLSQYRCVPKPANHLRARFELLTALLMEIEVLYDHNALFSGLLFGMSS
jgi:hypothetical protein